MQQVNTAISFKAISTSDPEYKEVFELREEVLRVPIGLSLYDEDLSDEVNDYIIIAKEDQKVLACLILTPIDEETIQLRQMAVQNDLQGQGFGKAIVRYAEQFAWEHNFDAIILHARMVAKGFYEKMNYEQVGDEFTEVGIPHVVMVKEKA